LLADATLILPAEGSIHQEILLRQKSRQKATTIPAE
jgi:hypothetical protein